MKSPFACIVLTVLIFGGFASPVRSQDTVVLALTSPVPYQVIQRRDFDPAMAHVNGSAPAMGHGLISVAFAEKPPAGARLEYRAVPLESAYGEGIGWTAFGVGNDAAVADVPAGGWYRFEVRALAGNDVRASGSVEPVGVGEVFIIAGQSYADNCNDEQFKVTDPQGRVAVLDPKTGAWRIAHDPQPTPSTYRAGTIWPVFGDMLLPLVRVPVGFANVAFAATASSDWMPGTSNFQNLAEAGKALCLFRCILWQQGESDVLAKASADTYVANITAIRNAAVARWGFEPLWLPAKSTMHPTVYDEPEAENAIRSAIARLWNTDGFAPGPDTDMLGGENRGDINSHRHFSGIGQQRAALMWVCAVWDVIMGQIAD